MKCRYTYDGATVFYSLSGPIKTYWITTFPLRTGNWTQVLGIRSPTLYPCHLQNDQASISSFTLGLLHSRNFAIPWLAFILECSFFSKYIPISSFYRIASYFVTKPKNSWEKIMLCHPAADSTVVRSSRLSLVAQLLLGLTYIDSHRAGLEPGPPGAEFT